MTITKHTFAPLFDDAEFTRRLIHDQQFVDLSERYDPIEPTDETPPGFKPTAQEIACVVLSIVAGAAMPLLACLL